MSLGDNVCRDARQALQVRLDEPLADAAASELETHLAACPDCGAFGKDLGRIRTSLRSAPRPEMPADLRDAILAATVQRGSRARRLRLFPLAGAAVAASIALVTLLTSQPRREPAGIDEIDTADAERQVRLVLGLTGGALRSVERAAMPLVRDEVLPIVGRVPLGWSAPSGVNHQ